MDINSYKEIEQFLEEEIVPRYDAFDAAHRREHVHYVMQESLKLAQHYPTVKRTMLVSLFPYDNKELVFSKSSIQATLTPSPMG